MMDHIRVSTPFLKISAILKPSTTIIWKTKKKLKLRKENSMRKSEDKSRLRKSYLDNKVMIRMIREDSEVPGVLKNYLKAQVRNLWH